MKILKLEESNNNNWYKYVDLLEKILPSWKMNEKYLQFFREKLFHKYSVIQGKQ